MLVILIHTSYILGLNLWFGEAVLFNDRQVDIEAVEKILLSKAILDNARIKSFHTKVSGTIALKCSKLPYISCLPATFFEGLSTSKMAADVIAAEV